MSTNSPIEPFGHSKEHITRRALEVMVNEMGDVVHDPDAAIEILTFVGFPRRDIPRWVTAGRFWPAVLAECQNGKVDGGLGAVASLMRIRYPANRTFSVVDEVLRRMQESRR